MTSAMQVARVVRGTPITAVVPVDGIRHPWPAVLLGMLPSGRLLLTITHRGITRRIITDPTNVRIPAQFRR